MIYSGTVQAKTGEAVPLFLDGSPMHSKYNPHGEALRFPQSVQEGAGCIVVGGIGGGFHLTALKTTFPHALLVASEADDESLSFCLAQETVRELCCDPLVFFCTPETIEAVLVKNYLPAFYGPLSFVAHRAWEDRNVIACSALRAAVSKSLASISADYSVQAHFGLQWERNILLNLQSNIATEGTVQTCGYPGIHPQRLTPNNHSGMMKKSGPRPMFDTTKTAAIIAAGPSLDTSIKSLKAHRERYVVFATDTAYGPLVLHGIQPDAVVSVDAQHISLSHLYPCPHNSTSEDGTLFVFDIAAPHEAVHLARRRGHRTCFFSSGHPLLSFVQHNGSSFLSLESGSGTVTIAACDFARQMGFARISLFGADFCYNSGKAYTRGTYLDRQFFGGGTRLFPAEQQFAALMFRTELEAAQERTTFSGTVRAPKTNAVLDGYRTSLCGWAHRHGYSIEHSSLVRASKCTVQGIPQFESDPNGLFRWLAELKSFCKNPENRPNQAVIAALPFVAWLKHTRHKNGYGDFFTLLKLAYSHALRYTTKHEDKT